MKGGLELLRLNGGLVSEYLIARLDLRKLAVSAVLMTNWILRSVGYMFFRPGMKYIGGVGAGTIGRQLSFVKSTDDTAIIELSSVTMRVRVDDTLISYPAVSTAVTNSSFSAGTAWTDHDEVGGTSTIGAGFLDLTSNETAQAIREQQLTIAAADQNVEHCLRIDVVRGPVSFQIGSTSGASDYFAESSLGTGIHFIAFTPTGASAYVRFFSRFIRLIRVDSCSISTGNLSITTPWDSQSALRSIRYDQSGDVIFMASQNSSGSNIFPRKIERRGDGRSWSLVAYAPEDGPFLTENLTPTTITASGLNGNVTLTASRPLFSIDHEPPTNGVGALFSLTSSGQNVTASITAQNTFTNAIRVIGTSTSRAFTIVRSNTFTATITLQRSLDSDAGPWSDVAGQTFTTAGTSSYNDGLDNSIAYYRIGVKTGDYTSGTADVRLTISSGSVRGICRITAVSSSTSASAEVLTDLGATTATDIWQEGEWSTKRGYPSALKFHSLRLWLAGKGKSWGSVSDGFSSFDETVEGDSAPINRSLTSGPVDAVSWIASLRRLIFGTQGAETSVITSNFDEPITSSNFSPLRTSGQGSGRVQCAETDDAVFFVNRSGMKLFLLGQDSSGLSYIPSDMLKYAPEVGYPGIVAIAVARQPETVAYCVLADGTCLLLTRDATEDVNALTIIETDGEIIDVLVMPALDGTLDDEIHFTVTRNINGVETTFVEKLAQQTEARGGVANRTCDAFVYYSGASTATITGLSHLNGEDVVVWGNGARISDGHGDDQTVFTVSGGQITLPSAVTTACVGLAYRGRWKSTKLAYMSPNGKSALGARKKVDAIGFCLGPTDRGSLRYGPNFDYMDPMPEIVFHEEVSDAVDALEDDMQEFPRDDWTTDARVCLEADSPGYAHVLAMSIDMETSR
jgi:hypothetical protein